MYNGEMAQKSIAIRDSSLDCCSAIGDEILTNTAASDLAHVFSALSDPVRLRILSIVAATPEVCSCALEEPLKKSQPTISHHTRILMEAGLIVGEKRGRWMWWRVVPQRLELLSSILRMQVSTPAN
jgi:ArsR family transcriptional regulator